MVGLATQCRFFVETLFLFYNLVGAKCPLKPAFIFSFYDLSERTLSRVCWLAVLCRTVCFLGRASVSHVAWTRVGTCSSGGELQNQLTLVGCDSLQPPSRYV